MANEMARQARRTGLGAWHLIKETYHDWSQDKVMTQGAALAYYAVFSLAPLLIIIMAVTGFFLGKQTSRTTIMNYLQQSMGPSASGYIDGLLKAAYPQGSEGLAAIIGVIILLLGATSVFVMLTQTLNLIWKVGPERSGLAKLVLTRLLGLALLLLIGVLLFLSVILSTAVHAMAATLTTVIAIPAVAFLIAEAVISFLVITVLFALIYKLLPDAAIAWRDIWIGALVTAMLFSAGKYGLGLYLGRSSVGSAYGAAGSLVVILLWIYYSAQIFLLGAEFTQVYARTYGSRGKTEEAVPVG
ncbi:MAG: YihY/virulence factor BrkB family protein [Deltaproteobacteria bacterium]